MAWNEFLPIYTTRQHGLGGITATYSVPAWMPLLAFPLVLLNIILWSLYSLYLLAALVIG